DSSLFMMSRTAHDGLLQHTLPKFIPIPANIADIGQARARHRSSAAGGPGAGHSDYEELAYAEEHLIPHCWTLPRLPHHRRGCPLP
ncbi:MAG: hypothetical protein ACKPKO_18190, partial [Candidatus Fonsibacter sp.]